MVIGRVADGVARGVEAVSATVSEAFFEPVVRLGVTGLSRAGKTVFITSLVANLMDRGRMPGLRGAASGAIQGVWLQPQPDVTLPRFDYETHLAKLTGPEPDWPEGTRAVSELRLSFRVQPAGLIGAVAGARVVHVDIVDYPGEWLLDLALLEKSYAAWSAEVLGRIAGRAEAAAADLAAADPADAFARLEEARERARAAADPDDASTWLEVARALAAAYLAAAGAADASARLEEAQAQALAAGYTAYLEAAQKAGWSERGPGRFLLPGDLAGAPVLTFAPLPAPGGRPGRGSLWREMEQRFEGYKRKVVKPFFREHFARIDRQVVLVDALGAIHAGPRAVEDMRRAMAEILAAFRPGRNAWLARLLRGRRVERILFAATKADHLHHAQHGRLVAIMEAMLREARDRADFAGARTAAMAIAALRTTVEEEVTHHGERLEMVRGRLRAGGQAAFHAGELPDDPAALLAPARAGAERWLDGDYARMDLLPAPSTLRPGEGPPHIRLDRAAEFLIGDRLA